MSQITKIQWCDSTVNPIMGCGGCELFPESTGKVMEAVDGAIQAINGTWKKGDAASLMTSLIKEQAARIEKEGRFIEDQHTDKLTNTNTWHMREAFAAAIPKSPGDAARKAALLELDRQITCYAAVQHLNKGANINTGNPSSNKGYAHTFENLTHYPDRVAEATWLPDLIGKTDPSSPWKEALPRMIFVSDMGDALTRNGTKDMNWLVKHVIDPIKTQQGERHLWLWLTKRPQHMVKLADKVGGLPSNIYAMTTLTGPDSKSITRLAKLKEVNAVSKGLSIEPLWDRIPPKELDLKGIDWVIVGGESGSPHARPFDLDWAREMRDHCKKKGVAFFLKQLGRNPVDGGEIIRLKDKHGGDWTEWPDESLKVREFPSFFHEYRDIPKNPQPLRPGKFNTMPPMTDQDQKRFKELDGVVRKAAKGVVEAGMALVEIRNYQLYRPAYKTFEKYCQDVHNMSRAYAYNVMRSGVTAMELSSIEDKFPETPIPSKESHLRELAKIPDNETRFEVLSEVVEEVGPAYTAKDITDRVSSIIPSLPRPAKKPSPTRRIETARETLDELEEALNEYEAMPEVNKLLEALRGNLG